MNQLSKSVGLLFAFALTTSVATNAQQQIYPEHFALSEVTLLDGVYKTAMERNVEHLMAYDHFCLLTPFVRQAGLSATTDAASAYYDWETLHPNFENWAWNPSFALDGHVGGHYISALALAYAASHDEVTKASLLERLTYIIDVLSDCQDAYSANTEGLKGYIAGLPDNTIWTELYSGSTTQFANRTAWVPFYCVHKTMAGLRDAYLYAGLDKAYTLWVGLMDWGIDVVAQIDDTKMDDLILYNEHGGVNEVYADLYALTGQEKYLSAAKKYSHQSMITGLQSLSTTFLDYKHANTQVPKYLGFERIAQVDASATTYHTAALNFWTDVVSNRTVCIGGNSVDEHFVAADNSSSHISNANGPESCNTNNMLKLSETLFDATHDAAYADFYERAMLNHILSTQDPQTGGYVYFTPLRPQAYKIYSVVNQAMWCCVGTGMENHSKYGHFAYTHTSDNTTLYINQFVASTLSADNFALTQNTDFPFEQKTTITINKSGNYTIALRHPSWTTADFSVAVNGTNVATNVVVGTASYVNIERTWSVGDIIEVALPMELRYEELTNHTDYIALAYGPTILAAATSDTSEELDNQYAGTGRMDHAPGSMQTLLSLASAPMLIGQRDTILQRILSADTSTLTFTIDASNDFGTWNTLTLKPFFNTHNCRYGLYWNQMPADAYSESALAQSEAEELALDARTLDKVATGEQQSEAGHNCLSDDSTTGVYGGEYYRDATATGYFEYTLSLADATLDDALSIMFRYHVADAGRTGKIYIDGELLRTVTISATASSTSTFYNAEYQLPQSLLLTSEGTLKSEIVVRMSGAGNGYAPGVYYIRLLKDYAGLDAYTYLCTDWTPGDARRVAASKFVYNEAENSITISATGTNNICLGMTSTAMTKYYVTSDQKYLVVAGTNLSTSTGASYLWWLNGCNKGTSVAPTQTYTRTDGTTIIVWDITESNINDYLTATENDLSGATIFGLTSTTGTSIITDINLYTPTAANAKYSEIKTEVKTLTTTNQLKISKEAGQLIIHSTTATTATLTDLSGKTINLPVQVGRNTYTLAKGFYIVQGIKILL